VGYFEFTDLHEEKIPNLQIPMLQVTAEPVMEFHQARGKSGKSKDNNGGNGNSKGNGSAKGSPGGNSGSKGGNGKKK